MKRKNNPAFGYLIAGCAFLFIPSFSLFDIMPDFIGFFLIICATKRLYDLNEDIASARSSFIKLFFIDLAKTVFTPLVMSFNDETTVMTYIFIFSILQGILLFFAFSSLLTGIHYTASRLDARRADAGFTDLSVMASVFTVARYVLLTLPELTVMTSREYQMTDDLSDFTVYDYKTLISVACFVISLVIGLYFFAYCVKYFNGLKKDEALTKGLYSRYENEVLSDFNLLLRRRARYAVWFFSFAFVFACPALFEGVDLTPTPVCFILLAIGASYLKKYTPSASRLRLMCIISSVVSTPLYAFSAYICAKYHRWSYTIHDEAVSMYKLSATAKCIDSVLLMLCACLTIKLFLNLLEEYGTDKTISEGSFQHRQQEKTVKKIKTLIYACMLSCVILCVALCILYFKYIENEIYWLFELLFTVIWASFCAYGMMKVYSIIEDNNT